MDLLVYLAQHAGQVVSKDQILADVWRQQFVAESVLSRSVADLRRVFDDRAERPRLIETIPKRGYRMIGAVSVAAAPDDPGDGPRGERAAPAGPGVTHRSGRPAGDGRPSIVVLPFVDMAPGRDQEYFCDGLAEELTHRLAHLRGLRVVARTSAFALRGRAMDAREIGRILNVGSLLEGSLQHAGDRVRVTVQLVDVADGCHMWSERFDRPAGDIFAIEDEIARAVVEALRVTLLEGSERRAMKGRPTNPAAHDLYLQGRHQAARRSLEGLEQARRRFEQAVALDPDYAAAHAGIAECHCVSGFIGFVRPRDTFPAGRAAAERALAIDPDFAEAWAVLGHETGMYEWRWAEAEQHFQRALEIGPGYALTRVWYSHLLASAGRFDEAIAQTERACECDPLSPTVRTTLGLALHHACDFGRAVKTYLAVLADDPSFLLARLHLGRTYMALNRVEAAVDEFGLAARAFPLALGFLAGALRLLGRDEEAGRALADLEGIARVRYVGAMAMAVAHRTTPAGQITWFARAFDEHEGVVPLLRTEPNVDHLRGEQGFQALLDRLGLPPLERSGA